MKTIWHVSSENKMKAELAVKKDEIVNRGSIVIKVPSALGMKDDGYYFMIEGPEHAIKQAEELLKGIAKRLEHEKEKQAIKLIEEEEDRAAEGFGNVLGF